MMPKDQMHTIKPAKGAGVRIMMPEDQTHTSKPEDGGGPNAHGEWGGGGPYPLLLEEGLRLAVRARLHLELLAQVVDLILQT